jgi:hypothetical protein
LQPRVSTGKPLINQICVFLFTLLLVVFTAMFFSIWTVAVTGVFVVVFFAAGYGFAAIAGLIFGVAVFLIGFVDNIVNAVTNPFPNIHWPWLIGVLGMTKYKGWQRDAARFSSARSPISRRLKKKGWRKDPRNVGWGKNKSKHDMIPGGFHIFRKRKGAKTRRKWIF